MSLSDLIAEDRTLVIAEIGVNHDGSIEKAIELIRFAAASGADAVKLQIFRADRLMHRSGALADYQKKSILDSSAIEMLRRYELDDDSLKRAVEEIRRLNLIPLATPFSPKDVEQVQALRLPAIKIASPDLVNWPLLQRAAAARLPMIISTGAATLSEISSSMAWLRGWNVQVTLLHCISSYPTPLECLNLRWIGELARQFNVPVGFSDHTTEITCGALAVCAGATVIEKHLTYDRAAAGPDHAASLDAGQFSEYVRSIRTAERMFGKPGKRVLDIERDVRLVSRQSLVAARDLAAGDVIRNEDLTVQRPGTGIPASAMPSIVGQRTNQAVRAGEMLSWQILAHAA
jgi:N-acetylneuraminate synthase/N,N'-diacetyllegionaminate synthase